MPPGRARCPAGAVLRRPYTALVGVQGYILIQTEVGTAAAVAGAIRRLPGVLAADDVIGPYDVIVRGEADTVDDLGRLVAGRMQMVPGVMRTTTCMVVNL
jgi:DNA-binding Lrp family transcriptional regulator